MRTDIIHSKIEFSTRIRSLEKISLQKFYSKEILKRLRGGFPKKEFYLKSELKFTQVIQKRKILRNTPLLVVRIQETFGDYSLQIYANKSYVQPICEAVLQSFTPYIRDIYTNMDGGRLRTWKDFKLYKKGDNFLK